MEWVGAVTRTASDTPGDASGAGTQRWNGWCTAGARSPGLGWCSGCITEPQRMLGGAMWAMTREDLQHGAFGRARADSRGDLIARAGEDSHAAAQGPASGRKIQDVDEWPGSTWGTCPLCGRGEAGAEHLII